MGQITQPLEQLARLLGIPGKLHERETPDDWHFFGEIDTSPLADEKTFDQLAALLPLLRASYGDALVLRMSLGEFQVLVLDRNNPKPPLDDLRDAVKTATSLNLDLKIAKPALAADWKFASPSAVTRLFLFPEALADALSGSLPELDAELFKGVPPGQKLIILVPDHDIDLDGPWLAIIGGKAMARWQQVIAPPPGEPAMLALAARNLNWGRSALARLTPLHLLLAINHAAAGDAIVSALHAKLFVCSAVYLARHSRWSAPAWTCTFASDRQETDVVIKAPAAPSQKEWNDARALGELAGWTYEKERDADDRLIVVQRVVVDALQNNSAEDNGTEILRLAAELSNRAQWGWESFIAGELKKYLSQTKELEETVEKTTRDYSDQVHALTKTVIDNMLAAVAVIVGSFIAAMFKSPFQEYAFRFGTGAYSVYLLIFPMIIGLTATWQRFQKSRESFAARRKSFEQRLTQKPVAAIVEPAVTKSEEWFRKWYGSMVAVYVAVLLVLLAAIVVVPEAIRSRGDDGAFKAESVHVNKPVQDVVTIRGRNFDEDQEIVVTIGSATFTNVTDPPTLKVIGPTVLTLKATERDLAGRKLTIRQGTAVPQSITWR